MRNRIFAVLAIAVLAGGGLAYGTYNMMNNQPVNVVKAKFQPVVVANADLSLGAELRAEDLKVAQFPDGQAPEGAFARSEEIVGPRRHRPDRQERADPPGQAGVEGSRLRAPAGHSRGHARRVGARQRGHRRRRLRPAGHARRRPGDGEPDATTPPT